MHDTVAVPATAVEQEVADRRWLAARLGDARREILAARRWAWQLDDERASLQQEVARLEAELASVRAVQDRQPRLSLVTDVEVPLGWPDAFPAVHAARSVDDEPEAQVAVAVVDGALALAPVAEPDAEQEWPQSTGAWGRRRGALALNVLPTGASRKERRSRHSRRG